MTDDAEVGALLERFEPAFKWGFLAGRLGLPGSPTVMDTKWGPVEGVRDGNTIRWDFPDHQWVEVRLLANGGQEIYRNDRLVGRFEITQDEPDEDDSAD
jgi:hypothetical protein